MLAAEDQETLEARRQLEPRDDRGSDKDGGAQDDDYEGEDTRNDTAEAGHPRRQEHVLTRPGNTPEPIRSRRDQIHREVDRHVTRRARSLSRPRGPGRTLNLPSLEPRPPTFETGELGDDVDSEKVFLQLMRVMIDQNRTQNEIQKEAQRQNARLMEQLSQHYPARAQDDRLTVTTGDARPSYIQQSDPKEVVRFFIALLLHALLRKIRRRLGTPL